MTDQERVGPPEDRLGRTVDAWAQDQQAELVAVRRHLHAHPELGFAEHETTAFLEQRLVAAGLQPRRLRGGTGLVCDVVGDPDGPVVVLRADIDALPLADLNAGPSPPPRDGP